MTFETTIDWPEDDTQAVVNYTYHRACRGQRDSLCGIRGAGPPLEPDEPAMVEIDSVMADGNDIRDEMPKATLERLEEIILEKLADDALDYD